MCELTPGGVAGSEGVEVPGRGRAMAVLTMADHHRDARPRPQAQLLPASREGIDEPAAVSTALSTTERDRKKGKEQNNVVWA